MVSQSQDKELLVECDQPGKTLSVWLPFSCSTHVELQDAEKDAPANLTITKMEGGEVAFSTQAGSCTLSGVKTPAVTGTSVSGNLNIDSLLGDVSFRSDAGDLFVRRVQSLKFDADLQGGSVGIESLYADVANVRTQTGDILIGDAHGPGTYESDTGSIHFGACASWLGSVERVK